MKTVVPKNRMPKDKAAPAFSLPKPVKLPTKTSAKRPLTGTWSKPSGGVAVRLRAGEEVTGQQLELETNSSTRVGGQPGLLIEMSPEGVTNDVEPSTDDVEPTNKNDESTRLEREGVPVGDATPSQPSEERRSTRVGEEGRAVSVPAVDVRVDYADLAAHFGGDWSSRVRLVTVGECEGQSCQPGRPLPTVNDTEAQQLRTSVAATNGPVMLAATADASGDRGDYSASPLAGASSWAAGSQSGDFTWSYPFSVPPGVAGPEPELELTYSSASVDGRTSSTNNQVSWVGEGFDLDPGFVERTYVPCRDVTGTSNAPSNSNDLCWRDDNLTLSIGGKTTQIIRDGTTNNWRSKNDDGSRIDLLTESGVNRDNNGEYWRLTALDGTRYYFGRDHRFAGDDQPTDSVSTVQVYGSKSGDPCHESSFAASSCRQAWRWSLDYVVDPHGNSMSLFYDQETNKYGADQNSSVVEYDRASVLRRIEYGTRAGQENDSPAPARVVFSVEERCIPSDTFDCTGLDSDNAKRWPDVPYDLLCTSSSSCAGRTAPTFFSRKRLAKVTTQVNTSGSTYADVNTWSLTQGFPDAGDGSSPSLWLSKIQQTGKAGTDVSLPPVTFAGEQLESRVDEVGDSIQPFFKWRVIGIGNGTGGSIAVDYSPTDCTASDKPASSALDTNARRCFPVWYQPDWTPTRQLEFFHKYRVDGITETDNTGGGEPVSTRYTYVGGDGWHYDDTSVTKDKYRTWNQWRGYERVITQVGIATVPRTYEDTLYLRGMHGDKAQGGGTRSVTVTDPLGDSDPVTDSEHLQGFERRTRTQLGASGAVIERTVKSPWISAATADDGDKKAKIVRVANEQVSTRLSTGGDRVTSIATTYNADGLPTQVNDSGDTSTATDNRCTATSYATDANSRIRELPESETTTTGSCGTAPTKSSDVISAERNYYDGQSLGAAPTAGNVTKDESASGWAGGITYQVDATTVYDAYGRATSSTDALGNTTGTAYAPATGFATTTTTTNPKNQATVTTVNRQWGSPVQTTDVAGAKTDYEYDALGRVTSIWVPGREKSSGQSPTHKYAYAVSVSAPGTVTSESLTTTEGYSKTVSFYDGLMRERQTQSTAAGTAGGRVVTEKTYDSRGWVDTERGPYFNSAAPSTTLQVGIWAQIPTFTLNTYDAAGRVTKAEFGSLGTVKWATSTSYKGDSVDITPPSGDTATSTVYDARGQRVRLRQFTGATPTGTSEDTSYTYTPAGQLASVTDSSGTAWSYTYDIRGRQTVNDDPDRGTTTTTYDALDRPVKVTDANNLSTWTNYDELGRKTELRDDSASGTLRASWLYDTLRTGSLTSSTRFVGTDEYTTATTAFDSAGRPTAVKSTLPSSEGALYRSAGYNSVRTYYPNGLLKDTTQPTAAGITNEKLSYEYDALGNVTHFCGVSCFASYTYSAYSDPIQRESMQTVGKSVYVSNEFDQATHRLTRSWVSTQGTATTPRSDLRYTYDNAGNVTKMNDVAAGDTAQTGASTWRQCYSYDHLRRMKEAWTSSGNTCAAPTATNLGTLTPYRDTYTYAKNGNRAKVVSVRKPSTALVTTTRTSTFPAATADRPHAATSVAAAVTGGATMTESFNYDAAGNTSKRSTSSTSGKQYVWDREGRVKQVSTLGASPKTVSYVYDADGNRMIVRDGVTGKTTFYSGSSEYVLTVSSGTVATTRNYTVNGELVATRTAAGLKIVASDRNATPLMEVDGGTLAVTKRRLAPFGEPLAAATWSSTRGFVNRTTDASVGTTHLDAREYDALDGRFLSVDPIGDPNNPQQLNGYAYANNSPVTTSDPTGLFIPCEGACGGKIAYPSPPRRGPAPKPPAPVRSVRPGPEPIAAGPSGPKPVASMLYGSKTSPLTYLLNQAKGFGRILFDPDSCASSVWTCAAEVGMVFFPYGKVAKVAKVGKIAGASGAASSRLSANAAAGNAARDAIAATHSGARIEQSLKTSIGIRRVDILTRGRVAIESKVGRTSLTAATRTQIAKDSALLRDQQVNGLEWVFTRSAVTGKVGPTGPLANALDSAGIPWRLAP